MTHYNRSGDLTDMMAYCCKLAKRHAIINGYSPVNLINRLSRIEKNLLSNTGVSEFNEGNDRSISNIGQLINQHLLILENQINKVGMMLSEKKVDLPQLIDSPIPKRLRVHDLCHEIVTYTDARIDPENLIKYITAYQSVSILLYDELKAIKVFLLFCILDTLCNVFLENKSDENEIVRSRFIFRNCICSISVIDTMDWQDFVDNNSCVDQIFSHNATSVYKNMDFFTRERYRNEISKLSKQVGVTEPDVAKSILMLSKRLISTSDQSEEIDLGQLLIGQERHRLEKFLGKPSSIKRKIKTFCKKNSLLLYLSAIGFITILSALFCLYLLPASKLGPIWVFLPFCLVLIIGLSHAAKQFIDAMVAAFNVPQSLPTLDFSKAIPPEYATLVTIPSLLTSEQEIERLVRQLKIYFIGNRTDNLYFSLLTDYTDAIVEHTPQDAGLILFIKSEITKLNTEFCAADSPRFFLFHRPRKWNTVDKLWMGYERKRGKLMDLNNLLRNPDNNSFSELIVDQTILPRIKYVITLDADTQLPRDTAWRLVAAMAHPLNHPVYSEEKNRTIAGYGMLQPKIGTDLRGIHNSLYERMRGFGPDIDPYTSTSPDVYQDLFDEGSFMGKGIYDVNIVNKALANRLPENRILSHDLLEGAYVRTGFLSNVKLHEQPVNYWAELKRRERWIRGDWQIASWIFPLVPGFGQKKVINPLSALSKWKIFDNLRNSLVPVSLLILIIFGWLVFKEPLKLSLLVLLITLSPSCCLWTGKLLETPGRLLSPRHWISSLNNSYHNFLYDIFRFSCLPYEGGHAFLAVAKAGWRLVISKRKRLEWQASTGGGIHYPRYLLASYTKMWGSTFMSAMILLVLIVSNAGLVFYALPVLVIWLAGPFIVYVMNCSRPEPETVLSPEQKQLVYRLSRKTWTYFDDQITEVVNWLPPDHVQEYPKGKVAYYTSPTNMGLCLLSYLTALDFGYITVGSLIERTTRTLNAMQSLERYRGHFYNWYDIKSLTAVTPRYVSTVDSGNLAGHLITLRRGLTDIAKQPLLANRQLNSLIEVLNMDVEPMEDCALVQDCKRYLISVTGTSFFLNDDLKLILVQINSYAEAITNLIDNEKINDFYKYWLKSFVIQVKSIIDDLQVMAPWLWMAPPPSSFKQLISLEMITLEELANWQPLGYRTGINREHDDKELEWLEQFNSQMEKAKSEACSRLMKLNSLVVTCSNLAEQEYEFLYKPSASMLSIGYKVEEDCLDTECYDMLASEARLATYVGICQNKLPVKSWFSLGRPLIKKNNKSILLSANGTMFEYLMPNLVMPVFQHTILQYANCAAVNEQIEYARKEGIPWGTSESCYGLFDENLNYQYRVFGIPPLSLKHQHVIGDRVVSPYATALALLADPEKAGRGLEKLVAEGAEGRYGLYEAIDYTTSRLEKGESRNIIRSFMVHHQGMSLLAFSHVLLDKLMQKRFIADVEMESGIFLLQEKLPENPVFHNQKSVGLPENKQANSDHNLVLSAVPSDLSVPEVQLLSSGRYHIVLNNREVFHTAFSFAMQEEEDWRYETFFHEGYALFNQYNNETEAQIKVTISHDDNMEIRVLTFMNISDRGKEIEIIAKLPYDKEISKKEDYPEKNVILCYKKHEADRAKFSCSFLSLCLEGAGDEVNMVFDEDALSIRYYILISPGQTIKAIMSAGIAGSREQAFELAQLAKNTIYLEQIFRQSGILDREKLKQIGISRENARLFRQLTGALLIGQETKIVIEDIQFERLTKQDKDIVILYRISDVEDIEIVVKLIQLHWYWRLNGLPVTVLILNEDQGCYKNFLQKLIIETITNSIGAESLNRYGGGIFIKMPDHLTKQDQILLQSTGYMEMVEQPLE